MSRQTLHYVKIQVTVSNPVSDHDKLYVGTYDTYVQHAAPEVMAAAARDMVLSRLAFETPELTTVRAIDPITKCTMRYDPNINEYAGGEHRRMDRVRP